ncbi:unnamed protein product [Arctogadus glacialis]
MSASSDTSSLAGPPPASLLLTLLGLPSVPSPLLLPCVRASLTPSCTHSWKEVVCAGTSGRVCGRRHTRTEGAERSGRTLRHRAFSDSSHLPLKPMS